MFWQIVFGKEVAAIRVSIITVCESAYSTYVNQYLLLLNFCQSHKNEMLISWNKDDGGVDGSYPHPLPGQNQNYN